MKGHVSDSNTPLSSLADEDFAFPDDTAMNDLQMQLFSTNTYLPVGVETQVSPLPEPLALDSLLQFDEYISGLVETSKPAHDKMNPESNWCSWMTYGVDLSVVSENPIVKSGSNISFGPHQHLPQAHYNANIIIQSLRCLPTMMLRRETFPWFIHPHSQLLLKPSRSSLPEALSTCMSIAQMFASRTPETNSFLWRAVKVECRNFIAEVSPP